MTLQGAKANLRALQSEVLVASVLGNELLAPLLTLSPDKGGAVGDPAPGQWSDGGSGPLPPPPPAATATTINTPSTVSSPFATSGQLLLWHLHQCGQAAPWAEATEVSAGRVTHGIDVRGGWQLAVGGWRLAVGGRRIEVHGTFT